MEKKTKSHTVVNKKLHIKLVSRQHESNRAITENSTQMQVWDISMVSAILFYCQRNKDSIC